MELPDSDPQSLKSADSRAKSPRVSVIIPARNAEATIAATLDALLSQDYAGQIEIVVADGSDTSATSEMIHRSYPSVRLIPNPEKLLVPGVVSALQIATGDILMRCDAHTMFPPGYISRAVETLERTGAANVGGRQQAVGTTWFGRATALAMNTSLGSGDARHRIGGQEGAVDTAFLGTFRRETLEEVGGYNRSLIRNEDYEFNYRLRKLGKTVWFDPALVVYYCPRSTPWTLVQQYFHYGQGKLTVIRKHPASVRYRHLAAPGLVLALMVGVVLALFGHAWWVTGILGAYLAVIMVGSVMVGFRRRDTAAVLLPLALAIMHLSWGLGFFFLERTQQSRR